MNLKPYKIQLSPASSIDIPKLSRVDYSALFSTLRFPLIWVYEHYLQAWLPREVDSQFLQALASYKPGDERLERRIALLGLAEEPAKLWWENAKSNFERDGYVVVKGLLHPGLCGQLADYYFRQPELHERWQDMPGIKRTSVNNSPLMRLVHQSTEVFARYVLGDVKTSYSFTSAYEAGTTLPKHTDRPQCVYNASIVLSSDPTVADTKRWPLMIEANGKVGAASLEIGDGVFYSGVRDPHWREALPTDINGLLGSFFHYVPSSFTGSLD